MSVLWADKDGLTIGEAGGGRSNVGSNSDLRAFAILTIASALTAIAGGIALVLLLA